jgi:transposase
VAYREVGMIEIKEVLRLWLAGRGKKPIARQLGLDPKTVRRYTRAAEASGLRRESSPEKLTDERLAAIVAALDAAPERERGPSWSRCLGARSRIEGWLRDGLRLTKVRKLLVRDGIEIPYPTLHRFAVAELGFGRRAATIAVLDGEPGDELQLDTGWVGSLAPDLTGRRRRFRAWIFTAVRSRHRFVYPCFQETTASAIEACEAAWAFFGGVFRTLLPDNTKAIIHTPDPLQPRLVEAFLEYAQARGFQVDPARVRHAKDKGRVERAVPHVRDDCFAGEHLIDLDHAREHARRWCLEQYGLRRHSTTQRLPLEVFETEEKPALLPAPTEPYDVPLWASPKVARDHYAQVDRALYSLPTRFIGRTLRARADRTTVRFYDGALLVKTHPRVPRGQRSTDPSDFPEHKRAYAHRDLDFLRRQAAGYGNAVGRFAAALLDDPLPWTRMRRVYALLGLARKYGAERLESACRVALEADMLDVYRLRRMLELPSLPAGATREPGTAAPAARFLRPKQQYALNFCQPEVTRETRNDHA